MKIRDLTGARFGKLEVVRFAGRRKLSKQHIMLWEVRCACGSAPRIVQSGHLCSGHTKSCGCAKAKKHGLADSPEYTAWKAMKWRCLYPQAKYFADYGGRGITVCERWRESAANFLKDMGPRPSSKHSLDRINNDGNYEPGNCRWATNRQQQTNKRNSHYVTVDGVTLTVVEWAEKNDLDRSLICKRIRKGWPEKLAVLAPRGTRRSRAVSP